MTTALDPRVARPMGAEIRLRRQRRHHITRPALFVEDRLGEALWSKQREILESVRTNRYTAVHSCHDAGKSFIASRVAAWWIEVHPPEDTLVVTTAPTHSQVKGVLWQEIGRAHRKGGLRGRVTQTEWWDGPEMVGLGRKPSDTNPAGFQGFHARYVLVVVDEACGIPEALWNAVDALVTNEHCRVLAIGNPDDPTSHFAKVCRPDSGWHVIHIDGLQTPNFTDEPVPEALREMLLSTTWVEERRRRWGEGSPLWVAKVRGMFPEDASDTVIPISWAMAAVRRWEQWDDDGRPNLPPLDQFGVDVAIGGTDRTVIAARHGPIVAELIRPESADTMLLADDLYRRANGFGCAVIDMPHGVGTKDRLLQLGYAAYGFVAGAGTDLVDSSGDFGFVDQRSAAWWGLRELLDPRHNAQVMLPADDDLLADLTTPTWRWTAGGRIRVESKDDIRKRLGRSTDDGDAVIQSFWRPQIEPSGYVVHDDPVEISPV